MADDVALRFRYMAAHIRLHSRTNPAGWTLQETVESYLLLPAPEVEFDAWAAAVNPGPSEEDVCRANRNAISILKGYDKGAGIDVGATKAS
jgi:hypothetical protein